jgi:4-hydroxyphenylpyruvate dioxygenase
VWEIVKAVDHPNIGIILDSFHSLSRRIPSASIADIPGDKITYVQLADAPLLDMDLLYWSRHFRNLPGQGGLDVAGFVAEILRSGYTGRSRWRSSTTGSVPARLRWWRRMAIARSIMCAMPR